MENLGSIGPGYESAVPLSDLAALPGWKRVKVAPTREVPEFSLLQNPSYRSSAVKNVITVPTDVFRTLAPDEDAETSPIYVPTPVMRRLSVFYKKKKVLNLFGPETWRKRTFTVMVGRHRRTAESSSAIITDPDLYERITHFTKTDAIPLDLGPYRATLLDLMTCRHPRRDINLGMFFSYVGAAFGVLFFGLDMLRDIFKWDDGLAAFFHIPMH